MRFHNSPLSFERSMIKMLSAVRRESVALVNILNARTALQVERLLLGRPLREFKLSGTQAEPAQPPCGGIEG